jgi:hypothetical protein
MTTTKIITNTIYYVGLIAAMIIDIDNFPFYFVIAGILIQTVIIITTYRISNRYIPNEKMLIKESSPFTFKDLIYVVLFTVFLYALASFLFKIFTQKYLLIYFSIGILSSIIQYLIIRGKNTPALLINGNDLLVNDLFVKTYNLEELTYLGFDGFVDIYIATFANNKRIKIRQDDYRKKDLNNFFTVMLSKSNSNVEISNSIKDEIMAAAIPYNN